MTSSLDITVPPGKARERLDVFLGHHVENATRSKIQQAIREGFILVDGKKVKPSYKVSPGETVHIALPGTPPPDVVAEDIPLDIVYEDDCLLVVNKPAGMVTHPAYANYRGTLVNALMHYCGENLSQQRQTDGSKENGFLRPGIVHRLDKDTSGLMVVAKDDNTHAKLAEQFSSRDINREYWAIVWGRFDEAQLKIKNEKRLSGIIEAPLGRSKSDRKKIAVVENGKPAVTAYEVLEEFEYLSLVKCKLKTGRTHQIRVHMHHIGHPVFGDPTYGGRRISWGSSDKKKKEEVERLLKTLNRQALHAKTIGFVHPSTGKQMKFESELPEDMKEALRILGSRHARTA
jgi:23S rRNA pseudouridine1911/1915/1917 synthase